MSWRFICHFLMLDESSRTASTAVFWPTLICILLLFFTVKSYSYQSETLPQGISNSTFSYGQITGLDERYQQDGKLVKLKDYKSIEFDAPTLARFNPQARTLVQTLNRFGLYNAGDLFNLGTLEFETTPVIKYTAPVYAYGITSNWTVGFGVPVIQYTNHVKMTQSLSNVDYYKQFRGLSPDLDAALDTDLGGATQSALAQKGYKPIEDRSENFIGDIQLVSVWKIFDDGDSKLIHETTLGLPTGPQYDPDDLLALNTFHKTTLENLIGYTKYVSTFMSVSPYFNLRYVLPHEITARVPQSADDVLPDESQKDNVTWSESPAFEVGTRMNFNISQDFAMSFDYRYGQKNADEYSSSSKGDTALLAENTKSFWHKVALQLDYSTVKSYLKKESLLPMTLSFLAYDTIKGENIERRTGQEISIALFY